MIVESRRRNYFRKKGMVIVSNAAERTIKWGLNGVNMVFSRERPFIGDFGE